MRALSPAIRLCIHSGPEPSSWRIRLRVYCAVTATSASPDVMAKSALWPNCETIDPTKSGRSNCSRLSRRLRSVMNEISKSSSSQLAGSSSTSSRTAPL